MKNEERKKENKRKKRWRKRKKRRVCRRGETSRISVNLNILAAQSSESMALTVRHPVVLKFWKISLGPSMAAGLCTISLSTAKTTLDEPVCAKKCLRRISLLDLASALYCSRLVCLSCPPHPSPLIHPSAALWGLRQQVYWRLVGSSCVQKNSQESSLRGVGSSDCPWTLGSLQACTA